MIPRYYSSRKSDFVRRGYLSLEQAIIKLADFWFYENLSAFFVWANKEEYEREEETDEHRRLDQLVHETYNRLRGFFYDEILSAYVIRPQNGETEPVPSIYWGSDDADKVIYQGRIENSYNYEVEYAGRVIVIEKEIHNIYNMEATANVVKHSSSGIAISHLFPRTNIKINIPSEYLLLQDAIGAMVSYTFIKEPIDDDPERQAEMLPILTDKAKIKLLELLSNGSILSYKMFIDTNKIVEIRTKSWGTNGGLAKLVRNSDKYKSDAPNIVSYDLPSGSKPNAYALVSADDLARYMSGIGEPFDQEQAIIFEDDLILEEQEDLEEEKPSNGAGRPPDFDGDLFLICAFEVIWVGGEVPRYRITHAKNAIDLYAKKTGGPRPSPSWAKNYIKMIWETMGIKAGEEAPAPDETPKDGE